MWLWTMIWERRRVSKQLAKKERDGKAEGAVNILIKKRQTMNEETMINSYPREKCPASLGIKN